jgi:hypothetical protein
MHAAQHCETKRMPRSGHDPMTADCHFFSNTYTKNGGAKRIRTPDLLHAMQHGFVRRRRTRPVTGDQSRFIVWSRLILSGEIWGRWDLVWYWFAALNDGM